MARAARGNPLAGMSWPGSHAAARRAAAHAPPARHVPASARSDLHLTPLRRVRLAMSEF
jgi:hypothetical protein